MLKRSVWFSAMVAVSLVGISVGRGFAAEAKPEHVEKMKAALPDAAPAKPAKARKVLVYTHASGFVHSSIPLCAKTFEELGKKTGAFEVTKITNDPAVFDDLKPYDAIVLASTTANFLQVKGNADSKEKEPARKQALLDFVSSGKGLIGIHAATDAYWNGEQKWAEYNELIGGAFQNHPYSKITIRIEDPSSPVNAQFEGKEFEFTDEIYVFRPDSFSRDRLRVLLSVDNDKSNIKNHARPDKDYAIAWIRQHNQGRVFYTVLGHMEATYMNPVALKYFLAGTQFALGDLKADATPIGKATAAPAEKK